MTKNTELYISIFCIVIAFFLGYLYAQREYAVENGKKNSEIQYIDISTSSKNITIKNTPENTRFRVNGEIIHTGSIELK